jgi:hypothetical protein
MQTSIVMQLVDRVTRPVRQIQQSLSGLSRRAGLDRLAASARRVGAATGETVTQMRGLIRRVAMIGGVSAGAVWGLRRLVGGFTEPTDAALKLSRRISMTFEELQLLQGAAGRMTSMGGTQLADNMERFSRRMAEGAAGVGEAAKAYEWAGISLRDNEGRVRSSMDVLMEVADVMAGIESEEMQQRFANALFGRSGSDMINMLQSGREGLEREMAAWQRTGQLVDEEDAEQAERYNDNLEELDGTIRGLRNTVIVELLPAFNEWLETINPLIQANHGLITERVLNGLREFWRGIQLVSAGIGWASARVGGFGNLIAIVAGILAGRFLLSVLQAGRSILVFGKDLLIFAARIIPVAVRGLVALTAGLVRFAVRGVAVAAMGLLSLSRGMVGLAARAIPAAIAGIRALSLALLTTPVGWIITGITAVAGLAYLLYQNWDGVAEWFGGLWDGIKAFFSRGIGEITRDLLAFSPAALLLRGIDAVFELFGARPLTEVGREWIGGLWSGITERWGQLTNWLSGKIQELTAWMPDWAKDRLGMGDMGAPAATGPEAALGAPVAGGGAALPGPARAEVGGELRIVVDSEGRPRVAEARQRGGMDFDVDAGVLGVAP